jgi:hypothetical protein
MKDNGSENDKDPTPEEQLAATALVATLEGRCPDAGPPQDALQSARLLQHAAGQAELHPGEQEELLGRILPVLEQRRRAGRRSWWWALLPAAGAAVILAWLVVVPVTDAPAELPRPAVSLLRAQGELLRLKEPANREYREQMQAYRGELYAALEAHYSEQ